MNKKELSNQIFFYLYEELNFIFSGYSSIIIKLKKRNALHKIPNLANGDLF